MNKSNIYKTIMNYQIMGFKPEKNYPVKDNHKLDLETSNIDHWEYIPPKVETLETCLGVV